MKLNDGYYLSIYSCVDKYLNNFKRSTRHDHNMSLWLKEGNHIKLLHHWEFERITGFKHHEISFFDIEHAKDFINQRLSEYSITIEDIQYVLGTPQISTSDDYYQKDLGYNYTYHALSHLFSSMMLDSKIFYEENILAFSFDGGSDCLIDCDYENRYDFLGAYSQKGNIEYFSIPSPGRYWIALKEKTGLEEGTLMALATATNCMTLEELYNKEDLIDVYKIFDHRVENFVNQLCDHIFAYSRGDEGKKYINYNEAFTEHENKISMMAKIIQEISLIQVDEIIGKAIKRFNINPKEVNISLSGGYALNCPTNVYIMNKYKFKRQLIVPCVNDGGQAVGMGLYFFYKNMDSFSFKLGHPYYGDSDTNMDKLLGEKYDMYVESVEMTMEKFVTDLLDAPIAWFDGRAEIGPRALGHRSILGDPTNIRTKELLNNYKQRQWWRPVSPIILQDELDKWFNNAFDSHYMLNNFIIKEEYANIIPAVIHFDKSARVQTINKELNPILYRGIYAFFEKTGIPMVCNTSLNDKGEPIINTIDEAMNFVLRKGIKIIYINGCRVKVKNNDMYTMNKPMPRGQEEFLKRRVENLLPLEGNEYLLYKVNPRLHEYNLNNSVDLKILLPTLRKISKMIHFY